MPNLNAVSVYTKFFTPSHKASSIQRAGSVLWGITLVGSILIPIIKGDIRYVIGGISIATFITGLPFVIAGNAKYKYWSKRRAEISFIVTPHCNLLNDELQSNNQKLLFGVRIKF